jgi:predicted oxidoreductase
VQSSTVTEILPGFGGGSHGYRALKGTFLLSCVITARRAAEAIVKG